ncbi:MAG: MmcQ/YjbR family DNA-binding protein [Bacteroidetes bacterium]|nr:MAG: MmcQ/YjbR family DNA-binding protein [Bacteroidota bacterium]
MNAEEFRDFCIKLPFVTESFPFDETTLVFKVGGKMFALIDVEQAISANLKCDPERAIELREKFNAVNPGYHMNKLHWNTVTFNEDVSNDLLKELIQHSYELIYSSLSKKLKNELEMG